jgi:LysR family nitrogen assimilation transcriptional regulator
MITQTDSRAIDYTKIAITQPALKRQIRELEESFATQLLHRLPRGVHTTAAGITLYESAQRILSEADRVSQSLRNAMNSNTSVHLGAFRLPSLHM